MSNQPIGIFDSGIGGLTVATQVRKYCPGEEIIYFGDTARVPYGTKSARIVCQFSYQNTRFLLQFRPKLVVIACHTASCLATDYLKQEFPSLVLVDVLKPSVEKALNHTRSGRIGVIGTTATINSKRYQMSLESANNSIRVYATACPLFVPLVEEGWIDNQVSREIASIYLRPLKQKKVDTVILACTHYPLLRKVIAGVLGDGVRLIDPSEEVAAQVAAHLRRGAANRSSVGRGRLRLYFSDCSPRLKKVVRLFLGQTKVTIKELKPDFLPEVFNV
ncbi:MAG: glutamate racemase [Candidatus Omnitrophica bacterium]|nr:glutamate racemase [Candidatus Omnitrophota bacterium]MCM8768497.1 glutamate racemase [Candidatus Omnitrophota bacterium]